MTSSAVTSDLKAEFYLCKARERGRLGDLHYARFLEERASEFDAGDTASEAKARVLGLHVNLDEHSELYVGDYVGAVWLDRRRNVALMTSSKGFASCDNRTVDYLKVWLHCLSDPEVSTHLDESFYCWPDEDPIPVGDDFPDLNLLLVLVFLRALHRLCIRHLRKNFVSLTDNLIGKVKGRLLLGEHFRRNIVVGRLDRASCRYENILPNCRENQILRTTLERCARYVSLMGNDDQLKQAHDWIHVSRATLAHVEIRRITPQWFQGIRYAGTFQHYRQPHRFAKMILRVLGLDLDAERSTPDKTSVPPFALCTYELFERFCQVGLRRAASVWAGYASHFNDLGSQLRVRPDFLLRSQGRTWIADAKYKDAWAGSLQVKMLSNPDLRADVFQVVTYSRHAKVLKILDELRQNEEGKGPALTSCDDVVVLYPQPQLQWNEKQQWFDLASSERILKRDFDLPRLYRMAVPLPGKPSEYRSLPEVGP